jgi:hypothetical protein
VRGQTPLLTPLTPTMVAAAPTPTAETDAARAARLQHDGEAIRALLAGKLPQDFETQRLFDVDLLDEDAIAARIRVLQARLAANQARRAALLGLPTPAATAGATPLGAGDATAVEEAITPVPGLAILDLEIERDALRLEFLQRPPGERATVIDAERKRRHIAAEEDAAKAAHDVAQQSARRAQAARDAALDEVQSASSAAAKDLAAERARAEAARAALATLKVQLADERQGDADAANTHLDREHGFAQHAADPDLDAATADALYDHIVAALGDSRRQFAAALDELAAPARVASFKPSLRLTAQEFDAVPEEREAVRHVIEQADTDAVVVKRDEQAIRLARATELAGHVARLNTLRLQVLPRLSADKRRAVLSFTGEGSAQLRREVTHLRLMARWYPYRVSAALRALPQQVRSSIGEGLLSSTFFSILLLAGVAAVVTSRHRAWLQALRGAVLARSGYSNLDVLIDRWLRAIAAVAPAFGLLVFVVLFFRLLDRAAPPPEIAVLESLALAYAWYRFGVAAVHHFLLSALVTARVEVSARRTRRIRDSVRLVGRYAFGVTVVLIVATYVLGRGYLFHLVLDLAWVGALPIGFLLTRHWQPDITEAYLRQHPQGWLAARLTQGAGRAAGVLAAAAAFFPVAVRGVSHYLQSVALRFEQTRRALAFLFRRRLERHAEIVGTSDAETLPAVLRECCSDTFATGNVAVDHFPSLDEVRQLIAQWRDGCTPGAAIALVGERGIGKTSWLQRLQAGLDGVTVGAHTLTGRTIAPSAVTALAARLLGIAESANEDAIVAAAEQLPPRLLILDNCQYLYLRAVGGGRGYQTLMDIIGRTCGRHLWVGAFSRYMWDHLTSVYRGQSFFRRTLALDPWDEESIGELIYKRMTAAGFTASYQDLIVRRVDGTTFFHEVIRTSERYRRLLWDYADGNPRIALHFWLRSLVPDGPQHVRVRLFEAPSADDLEGLQEEARFILGAVVLHQSLTVPEAARVLRYTPALCESLLDFLLGQGYLVNEAGRFYISTHWYRAVIRFLKRKHLVQP